MAEVKKATVKAAEVKTEAKAAPKAEVKAEVKEAPKAEAKAPVKKAEGKRPGRKPSAKKEAPKAAAKKTETVKRAAAKKAEVTETVNFQFRGKSYTPEELVRICKDVWKYDLNGKEEDFKSVELYVKPEENTTYYVINGDVTGSFFI